MSRRGKNLAAGIGALLSFAIATALLLTNPKALATAPLLLGAVVLFYLIALLLAFPTQMTGIGDHLSEWWRAYRGVPAAPPRESAPEVDHDDAG